jgi:PAS domain S-box-containing protein
MKRIIDEAVKARILDEVPAIVAVHDMDHNILFANRAYLEATGLKEEEIIGKKCFHAWGLERMCDNCPVTHAIEKGIPSEGEMTYETQKHWTESHGSWPVKASPLRDEKGTLIGAIETAFEISKEKAKEKRMLHEEEMRFKVVAENTFNGIIMIDDEGKVRYFNPASERIFGYYASEITGKDVHEILMPEEYREKFRMGFEVFRRTKEGPYIGKVVEIWARHRSGKKIPVEIVVTPLKRRGRYWAFAIIRDITERKRAKEKIENQLRLLSTLYRGIENIMEDLSLTGKANNVVGVAVESFGLTLAWLGKKEYVKTSWKTHPLRPGGMWHLGRGI